MTVQRHTNSEGEFQLQIRHRTEDRIANQCQRGTRRGAAAQSCWPRPVTCVVDGVPHLVAADESGLVGIVVFEDSLKEKRTLRSDGRGWVGGWVGRSFGREEAEVPPATV